MANDLIVANQRCYFFNLKFLVTVILQIDHQSSLNKFLVVRGGKEIWPIT